MLRRAPPRPQGDKVMSSFPLLEQPSLNPKGEMVHHTSHLQELHENRQLYAWPFQNIHSDAKNTVHCTSGMCLIHESLTHGFTVFEKIPRILFMRKLWHNGKRWQALDSSSRCAGLRPQACGWFSPFASGTYLVPSNFQLKIPHKRGRP